MYPKSADFYKVASELEPLAKTTTAKQFDMDEVAVYSRAHHKCGSIHCIAGWYYVATSTVPEGVPYVGYHHGAVKMANALGFEYTRDLEEWAESHPYFWGNPYGADLFQKSRAWDGAINLKGVVKHLTQVADKLAAYEKRYANQPNAGD